MILAALVCVQWASPSTLRRGSGTTEWWGMDAVLWWTPGGKQVTVMRLWELKSSIVYNWLFSYFSVISKEASNIVFNTNNVSELKGDLQHFTDLFLGLLQPKMPNLMAAFLKICNACCIAFRHSLQWSHWTKLKLQKKKVEIFLYNSLKIKSILFQGE